MQEAICAWDSLTRYSDVHVHLCSNLKKFVGTVHTNAISDGGGKIIFLLESYKLRFVEYFVGV